MNTERNDKIEEILGSLDGHPKATAPDFFYTRLKARMERTITEPTRRSWILSPAYSFVALILLLLINAAVILNNNEASETETDSLQTVAAEYSLNDNTVMYDLTQENN
jgi:hypothetical protein